jgi:hypothetical protein
MRYGRFKQKKSPAPAVATDAGNIVVQVSDASAQNFRRASFIITSL